MKNTLLLIVSLGTVAALGAATDHSPAPAKTEPSVPTESKAVENKPADDKVTPSKSAETKATEAKVADKNAKEEYIYISVTGSNIPKRIKKSDIAAGKLPKDVQMQLLNKDDFQRSQRSAPMKGN